MTAPSPDAESQLGGFIEKFEPKLQSAIRAARKEVRRQFPTANELVYDNYNFFVIGYCPTERPSDCLFSIAAAANGLALSFMHGAKLPDPDKLLLGSGKQNRFVRIASTGVLKKPGVQALMKAAAAHSKAPLPEEGRGRLIIRSISAKQRPRKKG